jgi:hypothetical protein
LKEWNPSSESLAPLSAYWRRVQGSTRQPVMADDQLAVVAVDMVLLVFMSLFIPDTVLIVNIVFLSLSE